MSCVVAAGFYGKLPARGDFIRVGLPRDFTDPWDDWLQMVLTGSQSMMGEAWLPAFLEAPVWRFTMPPGMCGSRSALGLMLPSVDRAGRYFPLTFAALSATNVLPEVGEAWLDLCEAAGRDALEQDTPPQKLMGMIASADFAVAVSGLAEAVWWSEGSTRVPPARLVLRSLPNAATYAAMLGAETEGGEVTAQRPTGAREEKWESRL